MLKKRTILSVIVIVVDIGLELDITGPGTGCRHLFSGWLISFKVILKKYLKHNIAPNDKFNSASILPLVIILPRVQTISIKIRRFLLEVIIIQIGHFNNLQDLVGISKQSPYGS